jgi:hypothetical protein
MDPREAIKPHPQGCVICFEIVPGSSRLAVPSGYNPWRRSLEAHLTEEPIRGRANLQLVGELARTLGISEQSVELMSGQRSSKKTILVIGMGRDEALAALAQRLQMPDGREFKD